MTFISVIKMLEFNLHIPCEPVACPRPRVSRFGVYYPKKYKDFKKNVLQALNDIMYLHIPYLGDGVHISYKFIMKRPKSLYRKQDSDGRILHTKKPDLDNLVKAINDVLQETPLLSDDSIIHSMYAEKLYSAKHEKPHISVQIKIREAIT